MKIKKFRVFFLEHKVIIQRSLVLLIILGVGYKWISIYIPSLPYISWPQIHLIIVPLIVLWSVSILVSNYFRYGPERGPTLIVDLLFWFSIFILFILWLLFEYYNEEALLQYRSVQLVLDLVKVLLYLFGATALITFSLSVKHSRTFNIFDAPISEKTESQKVVVLGRWQINKESRDQALYLTILFIIGLVLRLYNLDGFPPYYDEYAHTEAALRLFEGADYGYNRAFLTVTAPVYLSYLIFGVSLLSGRLPMVFINMLAIFPLFVLGKKLNRTVAYISVALFVFSPWAIAVARTVREYAILPFFFFLAAVYLLDLLDWEKKPFIEFIRIHKFKIVFLCLLLVYIFNDKYSIIKVLLVPFAIIGGLAIIKILKQNTSIGIKIFVFVMVVAIIAILIPRAGFVYKYHAHGSIINFVGDRYWKKLVRSEIHQWYFVPEIGYFIIFSVGFLSFRSLLSKFNKKNFIVLFCYLAFIANLIYFTYFFPTNLTRRTRYGILIVYWYLLVVAIALYLVYFLGKKYLPRKVQFLIPIILIVLFANYKAIWTVISYQGGIQLKITGEMHYSVNAARDFLSDQLTSEDVLVSDIVHRYDDITGNKLHPNETIPLQVLVSDQELDGFSVIEKYPQGWVACSSNNPIEFLNLPYENFIYKDKQALFYGMIGDVYLWQWFTPIPENTSNP
jgi:hypothetical protein